MYNLRVVWIGLSNCPLLSFFDQYKCPLLNNLLIVNSPNYKTIIIFVAPSMFYWRLCRPPPIEWQGKHYALKTEAVISNGFRVKWIVNEWLVSWTNNIRLTERCFDKALILKGPHGQWFLSLIISRNKVKTLGQCSVRNVNTTFLLPVCYSYFHAGELSYLMSC